MASYGVTCNISYTNNDDVMELGVHLTDSEGLDVSAQSESEDVTKLVDSVCADLMAGIVEQSSDEPEEVDEIQRLKDENERLRARIEQLQNKTKETKSTNSVPKLNVAAELKSKEDYSTSVDIEAVMKKLDKILADSVSTQKNVQKKTPKVAKVNKDNPFSWAKNVISADTGYWDTITGEYF